MGEIASIANDTLGDFSLFSDEVLVYILQFLEPKAICIVAVSLITYIYRFALNNIFFLCFSWQVVP